MSGTEAGSAPRVKLNRQRVLAAALVLVDRSGLDALTMRRLGQELGVKAMSLYKHVADKGEILDGLIDLIASELEVPAPGPDWQGSMRLRAASTRSVLRAHPWAIGLVEARGSSGPATPRYIDATIGALRAGGFSLRAAAHAFWVLDSFVYGHVIQELNISSDGQSERRPNAQPAEALTASAANDATEAPTAQATATDYPHLTELAALVAEDAAAPFDLDSEFEFGLTLILEALAAQRGDA